MSAQVGAVWWDTRPCKYCLQVLPTMPYTIRSLQLDMLAEADGGVLDVFGSMMQLTVLHMRLADGPHDLAPPGQLTQLVDLHLHAWASDDSSTWLPSSLQALTLGPKGYCAGSSWMSALGACRQLRSLTFQALPVRARSPELNLAPLTQLT